MSYWSQVYRLRPPLGVRSVSIFYLHCNRKPSHPQLHYFTLDGPIPMAIVPQAFYQQHYQATCSKDAHVRIFLPRVNCSNMLLISSAFIALATSCINVLILITMHGRQLGWVCLGSCSADVSSSRRVG